MNVLIVGNKGYVGRHLEANLTEKGLKVNGLEHDSVYMDSSCGCLRPEYRLPENCNAIIYLAQSPYYRGNNKNCAHLFEVNSVNAVRLARLAVDAGVSRFIYASSGNVYGASFGPLSENSPLRRDNWYSLSKVHAEEALTLFGEELNLTIVRPFGIYGPGQTDKLIPNLVDSISRNQSIIIEKNPHDASDNEGLRISLCYIDDVVDIFFKLIGVENTPVINLAGIKSYSIRTISDTIANILGLVPNYVVSEKCRNSNLIADTKILEKTINLKNTSLSVGISKTVKSCSQ